MNMRNEVNISGRLTADPELRYTSGPNTTAVCSFTIANEQTRKDGETVTDFFDCVAWRERAMEISKHVKKGVLIEVVGKLRNRQWVDKNGNKRRTTEIIVEDFMMRPKRESPEPVLKQPEVSGDYSYEESDRL